MRLILSLFIVFVCLLSCSERIEPYKGSRIFGDIDSKVTVFEKGNYARMIELQDGRLLCAAESDSDFYLIEAAIPWNLLGNMYHLINEWL